MANYHVSIGGYGHDHNQLVIHLEHGLQSIVSPVCNVQSVVYNYNAL